jgi:hypothetical protein
MLLSSNWHSSCQNHQVCILAALNGKFLPIGAPIVEPVAFIQLYSPSVCWHDVCCFSGENPLSYESGQIFIFKRSNTQHLMLKIVSFAVKACLNC